MEGTSYSSEEIGLMPFYTQERIPTPGGMEYFGRQYDPSLSVIFSESFMEGFRDITPMLALSYTQLQYAGGAVYSTEDQWESSEFFREGLEYDQDMTEGQARLLAERHDQNRRYADLMSRTSFGGAALGIGGYLVGSIPDPINFIPWLGMVKKGKQVQALINATTRGKRALRGVIEGAGGAIAFQPLYAMEKSSYQEEYDYSMAFADIAISAGIGGAFGGLFGKIHPKDPDFSTKKLEDAKNISSVPLRDRVDAVKVSQAQRAAGETPDAAHILNRSKPEPVTLDPADTAQTHAAKLAGAPSGVIKGSFVESQLLNPDGSLMRVYHGMVQAKGTDPFEAIVAGKDSNGMIAFTTDPSEVVWYPRRGIPPERLAAYEALVDEFPDFFEISDRGKPYAVFDFMPERLQDADVEARIKGLEEAGTPLRNKDGEPIKTVSEGNTLENMTRELDEGFPEIVGGEINPRFLNVKNLHPPMPPKEIKELGAEWFKKEGFDAVWSTEEGGNKVIFTVDPAQSKSIYEPEFRKLNEAFATEEITPVSNDPLKERKEQGLELEHADQNLAAMGDDIPDEGVRIIVDVEDSSERITAQSEGYLAAGNCLVRA